MVFLPFLCSAFTTILLSRDRLTFSINKPSFDKANPRPLISTFVSGSARSKRGAIASASSLGAFADLTPTYVPTLIRELSTFPVLYS